MIFYIQRYNINVFNLLHIVNYNITQKRSEKMIDWFKKHLVFSRVMAVLTAIFIFYISSQSFEGGLPGPEYKSYVYHFGIFFIFFFFLYLSLNPKKSNSNILIIFGLMISLLYAATDEIHQIFVINRSCSYIDFMTDSVGVLLSALFIMVFKTSKNSSLFY